MAPAMFPHLFWIRDRKQQKAKVKRQKKKVKKRGLKINRRDARAQSLAKEFGQLYFFIQ